MTLQSTRDSLRLEDIVSTVLARVAKHEGQEEFWEIGEEGQILVSVITLKSHTPMNAILRGGDINSRGLWSIPAEGTEVAICFDVDGYEGDAVLIGTIGEPPPGLTSTRVLLIGNDVEIRSRNGTARQVAFKDELVAVDAAWRNHFHVDGSSLVTSTPVVTAIPITPPTIPPTFLPGTPPGAVTINGTQKVKLE